jgi:hypothetical protein
MIIQCPNCGFWGKIPKYAVAIPQYARCLRCRHHFELASHLPGGLRGELALPSPEVAVERSGTGDADDPGSSSYELKAITADADTELEAGDIKEPWEEEKEDAPAKGEARRLSGVSMTAVPIPGTIASIRLRLASVFAAGPADPWYSRVLQAWGIFFLAWALLILVRSVHSLLTVPDLAAEGRDILSSVVSVLLLVPGAAGLFLLVDLGRYIRRLSRGSTGLEDAPVKPPAEAAGRQRPWPMKADTLPAVRAANGP